MDINDMTILASLEDILKNVFCNAIASKVMVRGDINRIFNKRKLDYLKASKESSIYNSNITESMNFETEYYTGKVLGILECSIKENNYADILELYKKSYRRIYNRIKDLNKIPMKVLLQNTSEGFEGNNEILSTLYILHLQKKFDICEIEKLSFIQDIVGDILLLEKYKSVNFSKEQINLNKDEIYKWKDFFGIENRSYTVEDLITAIIEKDLKDKENSDKLTNDIARDYNYIQKSGKRAKYIGAYEGFFKYLTYHTGLNFKQISLTKMEINEIFMNLVLVRLFNNFNDAEYTFFLISSIYIVAINKDYTKLRHIYLKEMNEDYILNINKLENNLAKATENTKRAKEEFKIKETNLNKKEKELLKEIEILKNENKRLSLELDKDKGIKEEVVKLREFIFNLDKNIEENNIESEDKIDTKLLNDKNIVIIGGSVNWVKKMKEVFPNWIYVSTDDKNKDLKFIKNNDFVFINIKMSHSLYFKIKPILDNENIAYDYIRSYTNIDSSISEINNLLKENTII